MQTDRLIIHDSHGPQDTAGAASVKDPMCALEEVCVALERLNRTLEELRRAQAALLLGRCSSDTFDALILESRDAKAEVVVAKAHYRNALGIPEGAADGALSDGDVERVRCLIALLGGGDAAATLFGAA